MNAAARFGFLVSVVSIAACGSAGGDRYKMLYSHQAVGTYIGGGSMMAGSDPCTYDAAPGVFAPHTVPTTGPESGPVFVVAPGTIKKTCKGSTDEIAAVTPTGAQIEGPTTVKPNDPNNTFSAYLVLDGHVIAGDASLDWQLGNDCAGVAEFAAVMGSQDTGGPDRTRSLRPTGKGTCTVSVVATTGSGSYESFKPATFRAETKVTVH